MLIFEDYAFSTTSMLTVINCLALLFELCSSFFYLLFPCRNLRWNKLQDAIPPEIGELKSLTHLYVALTFLVTFGLLVFPSAFLHFINNWDMISLCRYLSFNSFKGEIPRELADLPDLRYLYLHENRLTGRIPPELGTLQNLRHL